MPGLNSERGSTLPSISRHVSDVLLSSVATNSYSSTPRSRNASSCPLDEKNAASVSTSRAAALRATPMRPAIRCAIFPYGSPRIKPRVSSPCRVLSRRSLSRQMRSEKFNPSDTHGFFRIRSTSVSGMRANESKPVFLCTS